VPALKTIVLNPPERSVNALTLQRLAAEALGKIGEIEFLIRVLDGREPTDDPNLGAEGLGAAGTAAAEGVPALLTVLNGRDPIMQSYAARALGQIGTAANAAVPRLVELLQSSSYSVRSASRYALQHIGTPEIAGSHSPP
jgi:HEAT repeat protein